MKINNFSELDKVLKKSFSKIKDDMGEFKKQSDQQSKVSEKKHKNSLDLMNTKVKFLSSEIKKFKDYKNELINGQKDGLSKLKSEHTAYKDELKAEHKKELEKLKKDTSKLKDNFVKVMDLLKKKLVTKDSFEKNNKVIEKALGDLIEKTKDIEKIKFTYFSKLKINRQLNNVQDDMKNLKEDFSQTQGRVQQLDQFKDELGVFKSTAESTFVKDDTFSNKIKELDELKEKFVALEQQASRMSEQSSSSVDINLFNNEIEDIRKRLGMFVELENRLAGLVSKEELATQDGNLRSLEEKHNMLVTEMMEIKALVNENKVLRSEVNLLKDDLEKSQHKIAKNATVIDMLRATESSVKIKDSPETVAEIKRVEKKKEQEFEAVRTDLFSEPVIGEEKPGFFGRAIKGISDFFLEEEDDAFLNFDEQPEIKKEYDVGTAESQVVYTPAQSAPDIGDTKFVSEIERMFDEKSENVELNIRLEPEEHSGFLEKFRKGVVNFFFEEVDDEDEFVFQGEEIGKEDEARLSEPEEMPKVEIIEERPSGAKKKADGKKKDEPLNKTDKKVHYMRSRRPRIFDEGDVGQNELNPEAEVDNIAKRKKRGRKATVTSDAKDEYVYYPEDYFY